MTKAASADSATVTMSDLEAWLWDAACSIRGAIDAPKFKDYILPLIFVKRLSDVFDDEIARLTEKFGDRKTALELVEEDHSLVRFYIPSTSGWDHIRKLGAEIGQKLTDSMRAIAQENPSLQGVIDVIDFNAQISGQRIIEDARLARLIEILSRYRLGLADVEPDLFGRAYEYLLRKFAEGQGQAAGEFFTPREVGWLIARLLRPSEGMTVYDPACGSAGLLIKAQLLLHENVPERRRPLRLYGQERIHTTYAIAKMNMIIHDMEGQIAIGDTLLNPRFLNDSRLRTFHLVAANPMWNQTEYGSRFYEADSYDRFRFGYPPDKTADWGWVQHMFASLEEDGRAVIVLDTGVLTRGSGGKGSKRERNIRRAFVDQDLVEGVIQLPDNLFYNTQGPGILLCLNKAKPSDRRGKIIFIDAALEFVRRRPKNFLPEESVLRITEAFISGVEMPHFLVPVSTDDVAANDYNLSPSRYVKPEAVEDLPSLEEALSSLRKIEEEEVAAERDLKRVLHDLGVRRLPDE